jgi:hypothetical protein
VSRTLIFLTDNRTFRRGSSTAAVCCSRSRAGDIAKTDNDNRRAIGLGTG